MIAECGFCGNCGSSLTYRLMSPKPTDFLVMNTMSLDNPEPSAPTWHAGIESQMPWLEIQDDLPRTRCSESPSLRTAWESAGVTDTMDWRSDISLDDSKTFRKDKLIPEKPRLILSN